MTRLPPLDPAVARTRVAVRGLLARLGGSGGSSGCGAVDPAAPTADLVLVALSGGADSLALAAAVAFEAPRQGLRAGAVIVDHRLQPGSTAVADQAAAQGAALGLAPVLVRAVTVPGDAADGPEAAARAARYAALAEARRETGAIAILTAHTRDDQAEQVVLALSRGSGTRALAGIPPERGAIHRPFLGISRADTAQACTAQGLTAWQDPHNRDPAYARVRVRERLLPLWEAELGPGISANLARTAELAREDAEALDEMAARLLAEHLAEAAPGGQEAPALPVAVLAAQPAAVRNRMIRLLCRTRFAAHLSREHTQAVAALVTHWRGQGPIHVPGATVERAAGRVVFRAAG